MHDDSNWYPAPLTPSPLLSINVTTYVFTRNLFSQNTDDPTSTYAALAMACLTLLFDNNRTSSSSYTSVAPKLPPPPTSTTAKPEASNTRCKTSAAAAGSKATASSSSSEVAAAQPTRPRKRARSVMSRKSTGTAAPAPPAPVGPAAGGAGGASSAFVVTDTDVAAAADERHRQGAAGGSDAARAGAGAGAGAEVTGGEAEAEAAPLREGEELVPATKFLALVAAAEAIAELVRAEADLVVAVAAVARNPTARDGAQRNRRKDRGGDVDGDDDHDDSGDNDNDAVAERPSRGKNKGTSGSKDRLKRRKRGGAGPDQTGATAATARDIVLMEATRRTRSEWAWQRELSFLLIETCGGDAGADGGDLGDAGEGVGGERCNDVQQAARAAVDRVLAGTEDVGGGVDGGSNGSGGGKVFRELKRVDDTVGAACTGVISLLLQVPQK